MDGGAHRRGHGGVKTLGFFFEGWVGYCTTGHIERVMTHVAQTGAVVTATV